MIISPKIILSIILLFCFSGAVGDVVSKKILIISSYGSDYQWSNRISDKINIEVKKHYPKIEFNVEYLSSETFIDSKMWVERVELILNGYKDDLPVAVILISDEAWMAYRASNTESFRGVPVILCGVKPHSIGLTDFMSRKKELQLSDFISTNEIMSQYNACGVIRAMNIPKYIYLMNQLIPNLDKYLLITDHRFYGIYTHLVFDSYVKTISMENKVDYLDARYFNTDSLLLRLSNVDANTGVLMTSWLTGEAGFDYSREFVYNEMSSKLKSPIFITNDIGINTGNFIGGYFSESSFWGEKASAMILKVLSGISVDKIPIETYVDEQCHVNWEVMTRFEIPENKLPEAAIMVNRPESIFNKYKSQILSTALFCLLCIILIISILRSNIRHKRARAIADAAVADSYEANKRLVSAQQSLKVALEKAEAADWVKSAFISKMDSEIRTPLNTIMGFSNLIVAMDDKKEIEEAANQIFENSEKLLELVKTILDLSKIESGDVKFVFESVCIDGLLKDLVNKFISRNTSGTAIKYIIPSESVTILTEPHRLVQVLTHLIENALKFTRDGVVEVGYFSVDEQWVEIYVKDTGVGIKPENIAFIFDRFYKANHYSAGSGLGLSISHKIVEMLKGKIGVVSDYGSGSRFWIRLRKDIVDA